MLGKSLRVLGKGEDKAKNMLFSCGGRRKKTDNSDSGEYSRGEKIRSVGEELSSHGGCYIGGNHPGRADYAED